MVRPIETSMTRELNYQVQAFFQSALSINDVQTVKRLLKHHKEVIDVNASTSQQGITPLHRCVFKRNKPMMSVLLRAGANINTVDRNGWSCLHTAVRSGNYQVCEYLLRKGADPMAYTLNRELPVDLSTFSPITFLLVDVMQEKGHDALARYHLSRAVAQQRREVEQEQMKDDELESDEDNVFHHSSQTLNSILKRRSSKSKPSSSASSTSSRCSWSSTSSATSASDESEAETSSVHSSTSSSSTGLSVQFSTNTLFLNYVHENEYELLDMLLEDNKISILNKLDRKGLSTIHWASINGFHECVRVLAKHGANVDIVDPNGWTPLHAAVITGNIKCVEKLLCFNPSVYAVTNSGETVFDMTDDMEIRKLLVNHVDDSMTTDMRKSIL